MTKRKTTKYLVFDLIPRLQGILLFQLPGLVASFNGRMYREQCGDSLRILPMMRNFNAPYSKVNLVFKNTHYYFQMELYRDLLDQKLGLLNNQLTRDSNTRLNGQVYLFFSTPHPIDSGGQFLMFEVLPLSYSSLLICYGLCCMMIGEGKSRLPQPEVMSAAGQKYLMKIHQFLSPQNNLPGASSKYIG